MSLCILCYVSIVALDDDDADDDAVGRRLRDENVCISHAETS